MDNESIKGWHELIISTQWNTILVQIQSECSSREMNRQKCIEYAYLKNVNNREPGRIPSRKFPCCYLYVCRIFSVLVFLPSYSCSSLIVIQSWKISTYGILMDEVITVIFHQCCSNGSICCHCFPHVVSSCLLFVACYFWFFSACLSHLNVFPLLECTFSRTNSRPFLLLFRLIALTDRLTHSFLFCSAEGWLIAPD